MLEKIPGVDTNVEKQKRELEFYQNKYKEKWYYRCLQTSFLHKQFEKSLIFPFSTVNSWSSIEHYRCLPKVQACKNNDPLLQSSVIFGTP
jgi:hypothetical protein